MADEIKVKNLQSVSSISGNANLLALTDNTNNIVNLITKDNLKSDFNADVQATIGNLGDLQTTNKTNVVSAINENKASINVLNPLVFAPVNTLASSGSITLQDNSANQITPTGNVTFVLPTINDNNTHQIEVNIKLDTIYTFDLGTTYYYRTAIPNLTYTGNFELIYTYDHLMSKWRCGCVAVGE